tara:strand:- start:5505 stop:6983 length:1479 start_codon:yes stop_codon:yes gene_type:complete
MINKINLKNDKLVYFFLSLLFVLTVQQFDLYKGNAAHLIHSIKFFDTNKLQNDWIANQENHLPLFAYFNHFLIKIFSKNIIYVIHSLLLGICPLYLFLISKNLFPKIKNKNLFIIWFSIFTFIFHENSFFSGVAGQNVIDAGYQPASFGTLIFVGIYLFLIKKDFLSIFFICLAASFHPTYVLHSGFLVLGFLTYYFLSKKYINLFKVLLIYSILILPITIFIILNFMMIDKNLVFIGQKILLERIPHHANIHYWFTYKDVLFLLVYFISLFLIKNNFRFLVLFSIFGFCSIFLSVFQYFLDNNSLALTFPWRTSVFIVPISSLIILSYFINKIKFDEKKLMITAYSLILIISLLFMIKSHYIKNLNLKFKEKLILANDIKKNFKSIDRLLIPVNLDYIRMNTGLPIFIDWKHHAFRYDQLIEWRLRMDLANNFYGSKTIEEQLINLNKIREIEDISHILITKDKLKINCNDLINHDLFMLINVKDCYDDKF